MQQTAIVGNDRTITGQIYTGNLSARMQHPDGRQFHTFRTYTAIVEGNRLTFDGCRFENTAGPGKTAGQALALYVDGDEIRFENCHITGHQDTLFLAPLPPFEYEHDGFIGPGYDKPRTMRQVYFHNCLIEGGIDFIFGGASAVFEECEFRSVEPGFVFAPCTPEGETGFVARRCRFTAAKGVPEASCYLGRPWREYAAVALYDCEIGAHIHPEGWHDWDKTEARKTVRFSESGSFGPGACMKCRPEWVSVK